MCVGYVISFRLEVGQDVEVLSLCHQVATCKNDGTCVTDKHHTKGKPILLFNISSTYIQPNYYELVLHYLTHVKLDAKSGLLSLINTTLEK